MTTAYFSANYSKLGKIRLSCLIHYFANLICRDSFYSYSKQQQDKIDLADSVSYQSDFFCLSLDQFNVKSNVSFFFLTSLKIIVYRFQDAQVYLLEGE